MRKIFISAGHSVKRGRDRGASGNGFVEGELMAEFRDLLVRALKQKGVTPIVDKDDSIFRETINYFLNLTTNSCIVLDLHTNAASPQAQGTETLVPAKPTEFELNLASALSLIVSQELDIPLRGRTQGRDGVKTELQSHHGRLGWMRLTGENVLMELFFISNAAEVVKFQERKVRLANRIAEVLIEYAKLPTGKTSSTPAKITYTVVQGDSLWSISKKHKTTIDALTKANNMNIKSRIVPGQKLIIP